MNRVRLRLLLRDLGVGAAFLSMALSGQVPTWAALLFVAGLTLAVLNLRIFAQRNRVSALALLGAAVALYAMVATGKLDLVVAACTFAGLLACQRMLTAPSETTDNQVHLTSLLMIAGGAALSGDLLFAPCLMAFAVLASLSLGMAVVEGARSEAEDVPMRPLMRVLVIGIIGSLLGGVVFFFIVPRLSWSIAGRRPGVGLGTPTTGFSDKVQIGGAGRIKTSPRIVLRATVSPDPRSDRLDAYWVGKVFDHFDGVEWSGNGTVPQAPTSQVTLRHGGRDLVLQQVELLPAYASRTLVGLDVPIMYGQAVLHQPSRNARARLIVTPGEQVRLDGDAPTTSYQVYSRGAVAEEIRWTPEEQARALELPEKLDPRVRTLARQIVGKETDPVRQMRALERYLSTRYEYTLDLPGEVKDPLVDFLFERKRGHCEHFATALSVMLRTLDVPAQVVAGYYGAQRTGGQYLVRAGDAHAWVQAYGGERGVIRLDATPPAGRQGQPNFLLDFLVRQYEALETRWQSSVLDYSFRDQAELAQKLVRPPERRGTSTGLSTHTRRYLILAGIVALVAFVLFRLFRGVPARARETTALVDEVEAMLARVPAVGSVEEGLEHVSVRLHRERHPLAPAVGQVTRRYVEARFGDRPLRKGERRALRTQLERAIDELQHPDREAA